MDFPDVSGYGTDDSLPPVLPLQPWDDPPEQDRIECLCLVKVSFRYAVLPIRCVLAPELARSGRICSNASLFLTYGSALNGIPMIFSWQSYAALMVYLFCRFIPPKKLDLLSLEYLPQIVENDLWVAGWNEFEI